MDARGLGPKEDFFSIFGVEIEMGVGVDQGHRSVFRVLQVAGLWVPPLPGVFCVKYFDSITYWEV
jgi:hypothetical protein